MAKIVASIALAEEAIISKIYLIRGKKVMVDRDLAELYEVETKQLKRQVRRNIDRFPDDFMFELNDEEFKEWRCHFGTSKLANENAGDGWNNWNKRLPGMTKV
jgi:23S rRNA A2030 N6-methylase RlmJ